MVAQSTIIEGPTESELVEELRAHRERYVKPNTFTISHVFVNRTVAPDSYAARQDEIWQRLNAGADVESVGDHFARGPVFERLLKPQLEAALNIKLGAALQPEQRGKWQKFTSPRGTHFVRLDEIVGGEPTLEQSRHLLVENLNERKKAAAVRVFVDELRAKFTVLDESKP